MPLYRVMLTITGQITIEADSEQEAVDLVFHYGEEELDDVDREAEVLQEITGIKKA